MKASAVTSGVLGLGLTGSATAQQTPDDGGDEEFRPALMFGDEFHSGGVFRVVSPALQDPPIVDDGLANYTTRVIEYFNTNEEAYLLVPQNAEVQEGDLYVLGDSYSPLDDDDALADEDFVQIQYRPLGQEEFPFELEEDDGFEILEDQGGGEAAIRPGNFYAGALFRITSGPQGWVPEDVSDSGFFTDYQTHHAEYLGTNDEFLFFPQEDAQVNVGRLYVMWNEFEFSTPEGNLVATEFDVVNEESLEVDDEFL